MSQAGRRRAEPDARFRAFRRSGCRAGRCGRASHKVSPLAPPWHWSIARDPSCSSTRSFKYRLYDPRSRSSSVPNCRVAATAVSSTPGNIGGDAMIRRTLFVTAVLVLLGSIASAAPTPAQKCEVTKNKAAAKKDLCLANEHGKALEGKPSDPTKCTDAFEGVRQGRGGSGQCGRFVPDHGRQWPGGASGPDCCRLRLAFYNPRSRRLLLQPVRDRGRRALHRLGQRQDTRFARSVRFPFLDECRGPGDEIAASGVFGRSESGAKVVPDPTEHRHTTVIDDGGSRGRTP